MLIKNRGFYLRDFYYMIVVYIKFYVVLLQYHKLTCFSILPILQVFYHYIHIAKEGSSMFRKVLLEFFYKVFSHKDAYEFQHKQI